MRFYGGTPLVWLRDTPIAVVEAHVEMINRLTAEETLLASTVVSVGARKIKSPAVRGHLTQWERAARPRRRMAAARATPGQLQAIGIACHVVERSGGTGMQTSAPQTEAGAMKVAPSGS